MLGYIGYESEYDLGGINYLEESKNAIIRNGLALYLDAANSNSYSGLGTTWTDLSGNENNGTLINGVSYSGDNKGALVFDGVDDYVTLNATGIDFSSEQTIFMILRPEESDENRRNPYNHAYGGYGTITHETSGSFNYYHGTSGSNSQPYQGSSSSFAVNQNEIASIALTRNSSEIVWYKNGNISNSKSNSYPTASTSVNTILIGDGYTNSYFGKIYCCLLYTRALSAKEVLQNFNAIRGRYGI